MESRSSAKKVAVWDVVIVGGGPAGAATAITLANKGRRVLLLEKQSSVSYKLGESLPPACIGLVEHFLGAIGESDQPHFGLTRTAGNLSLWASETPDHSDFFFTSTGFGLCLDRVSFDDALRNKAIESGVTLYRGTHFKQCSRITAPDVKGSLANWNIELRSDSGSEWLRARYLVDCTGRQAIVAKAVGIDKVCGDQLFAYAQRFVSNTGEDNDCLTRLEAAPQGWWYSNRLPNIKEQSEKHAIDIHTTDSHRTDPQTTDSHVSDSHTKISHTANIRKTTERIVVFHTDKNLAAAKQAADVSGFSELLEQTSELVAYLKKYHYKAVGKIRGASAASERLSQFAELGWMAVGDAAQAYDPLSSQGIHKALTSGNFAGDMIHYALEENEKEASDNENINHTHSKLDENNIYIKRYVLEQERLWADYLKQHQYFYQNQPRWSDHAFWHHRHNAILKSRHQQLRDAS